MHNSSSILSFKKANQVKFTKSNCNRQQNIYIANSSCWNLSARAGTVNDKTRSSASLISTFRTVWKYSSENRATPRTKNKEKKVLNGTKKEDVPYEQFPETGFIIFLYFFLRLISKRAVPLMVPRSSCAVTRSARVVIMRGGSSGSCGVKITGGNSIPPPRQLECSASRIERTWPRFSSDSLRSILVLHPGHWIFSRAPTSRILPAYSPSSLDVPPRRAMPYWIMQFRQVRDVFVKTFRIGIRRRRPQLIYWLKSAQIGHAFSCLSKTGCTQTYTSLYTFPGGNVYIFAQGAYGV